MTSNLFSVKDKIILITGASSGLGCHFAKVLANEEGARIAIAARRVDKLQLLAQDIHSKGGIALPIALDIKNFASIHAGISLIEKELGAIDVLINNAGVDTRKTFLDHAEADWDTILNTNLKGTCVMSQQVVKHMLNHHKKGSIINISSAADVITYVGGSPAYLTSKAGVSHLTRVLALELASHQIRVNAIAPAGFFTECTAHLFSGDFGGVIKQKIPLQRYGELDDINGPLLLLSSEASRYMTGCIIRVDGGLAINKIILS